MNKQKQIKELSKDLCQNVLCNLEEWNSCEYAVGEYCDRCKRLATRLVAIGWQKGPIHDAPDYISEVMDYLESAFATELQETCTDEDGNVLIFERIPSDAKKPTKPMSMEINLDNVDIDREVHMLEQAAGEERPWMTEYARKRMREQIIEYLNEKKKGD